MTESQALLPTPMPQPGVPTKIPVLSIPEFISKRLNAEDVDPKKTLSPEHLEMLNAL